MLVSDKKKEYIELQRLLEQRMLLDYYFSSSYAAQSASYNLWLLYWMYDAEFFRDNGKQL